MLNPPKEPNSTNQSITTDILIRHESMIKELRAELNRTNTELALLTAKYNRLETYIYQGCNL